MALKQLKGELGQASDTTPPALAARGAPGGLRAPGSGPPAASSRRTRPDQAAPRFHSNGRGGTSGWRRCCCCAPWRPEALRPSCAPSVPPVSHQCPASATSMGLHAPGCSVPPRAGTPGWAGKGAGGGQRLPRAQISPKVLFLVISLLALIPLQPSPWQPGQDFGPA